MKCYIPEWDTLLPLPALQVIEGKTISFPISELTTLYFRPWCTMSFVQDFFQLSLIHWSASSLISHYQILSTTQSQMRCPENLRGAASFPYMIGNKISWATDLAKASDSSSSSTSTSRNMYYRGVTSDRKTASIATTTFFQITYPYTKLQKCKSLRVLCKPITTKKEAACHTCFRVTLDFANYERQQNRRGTGPYSSYWNIFTQIHFQIFNSCFLTVIFLNSHL